MSVEAPQAVETGRFGHAGTGRRPSRTGVVLTGVSWNAPDGMGLEEWVEQGRRLGLIGRGVGWWIGDWLNYGNAAYGEKYSRAARITGYDAQSLMNMAYVASRVEISRRRETLSWSHHAELASLPTPEQEEWLERCQANQLSVRDLRQELRMSRRTRDADPGAQKGEDPDPAPSRAADAAKTVCPQCGFHFMP